MSTRRVSDDGLPVLTWVGDDELVERAVMDAQLAILTHPVAAQATYRALVAEGRAAATTPEGRARRDRLARSPLLARVRAVWEPSTFNLLEADTDSPLPSSYVEALVMALDAPDLDALLSALAGGPARARHGE